MHKEFFEIDDIIVNREIFTTKFACDLKACKGACCTMPSEYGAPVLDKEIHVIENILEDVYKYLPEKNIDQIKKSGFWEEKHDTFMITSINNRDCVFSYYEGDIAKCAFEKAYFAVEINFRKPISCHLFPIRVNDFGGPVLKFEEYNECQPALENGKATNTTVLEFCKDALIRAYGEEFYNQLVKNGTE